MRSDSGFLFGTDVFFFVVFFFRGEGQRWGDVDRLSSRLKLKDGGRNTDSEHEQSGNMPSRRILVW